MTENQAVGYKLLNTSSITALTGQRIIFGARIPIDMQMPCINFARISIGDNMLLRDLKGTIENPTFRISCRAETPSEAMTLSRLVIETFHNLQESINSEFDINICNVKTSGPLLSEDEGNVYHIPIDIQLVYQNNTLS